jgi:transcriptional regulator with XRE-family HTH domain
MKPLPYDIELIELVKTLRERYGYKHINMAEALDIDRSTYSRFESGDLAFSPGQLKIMAKELRTNHHQLQFLVDSKGEREFFNTTFSTILISTIKMIEGKNEAINFSEAELHFVISVIKNKYEEMWREQPLLRLSLI